MVVLCEWRTHPVWVDLEGALAVCSPNLLLSGPELDIKELVRIDVDVGVHDFIA